MKLLTQYEEKLTTVPRWGIVRTIQKQSVADHSFLVAVLAPRIAVRFFHYSETLNADGLYEITRAALLHDQHEAFTGDIPSPVKPAMDKVRAEAWFDNYVNEKHSTDVDVKTIVKLADYLESLRFLKTEIQMGNLSVDRIYRNIRHKFSMYCEDQHLSKAVANTMLNEVLDWDIGQDPLDAQAISEQGGIPF